MTDKKEIIEEIDYAQAKLEGYELAEEEFENWKKEFIKKLKDVDVENDFDVMLMDGEDGEVTISLSEYIDKLAGDDLTK